MRLLLFWVCLFACSALHAQLTPPAPTAADVDYTIAGAPMPSLLFMSYTDTSSTQSSNKHKRGKKKEEATAGYYTLRSGNDIANDANLFIMIFSPECDHCNRMAGMLTDNAASFRKSKLLLLTTNVMADLIPEFAAHHQLRLYPHTYIGFDSSQFAKHIFLYRPLPQINIYSPQRTLIKTYTGEVPFDSLRNYMQ